MSVLSVLVGTATRTGGTAAFVGESARELDRLGEPTTIFATDLALASAGWIQRQRRITAAERHPSLTGTDLRIFPARFPRRLAYAPALGRALDQATGAGGVLHLHNLWQYPQYAGYRAARRAGSPYVVSPHGALDPYLRRHGRLRKRMLMGLYQDELLRGAALIHVTTESERELIADVAPEVPRAVVPCGIYVEQFEQLPDRSVFRQARLGGYDGPVVLFLSRLSYKKGLDVLVRAFARARRACDCRLVIAGPDDEGQTPGLRRLAAGLGIGDDVLFAGPVFGEERLAALAAADVWALSSYAENFAIAVIEAMAAGCPVAISDAVNLADEVRAGGAGAVARPDPEAFGDVLLALLEDEGVRARLAGAGRRFARRYDWSVVGPQLVDMYRRARGDGG